MQIQTSPIPSKSTPPISTELQEQARAELKRRAQEARAELIRRRAYSDLLPYRFRPRKYQTPFQRAMQEKRRAALVWHRRAGKDKTMLNFTFQKMFERVGIYYYILPTYAQGKKIVWEGIDRDGFRHLNHMPMDLRRRTNNAEMLLETINGSIFRIVGSDNFDSIMGTNPVGVVFSEYSLQNPVAWDMIRPILAENDGWALFNFTPRGKNHGWELAEMAQSNDRWFYQKLTVDDTKRPDGTPVITPEIIQEERDAGMDESLIKQEFYCDFNAANTGAYYGEHMMRAENEGRIINVKYEPELPVNTYWDLGRTDSTAIIFAQLLGHSEYRIIDYYECSNIDFEHYAEIVKLRPYRYGKHYAPHDIKVKEYFMKMSRLEAAKAMGIKFEMVPELSVQDGIDAVRRVLPKCWFDNTKKPKDGNSLSGAWWLTNALKSYHREWDEKRHCYRDNPVHDWSSHPADAFRYFAVATRGKMTMADALRGPK
jgi:phage terminase large subunit